MPSVAYAAGREPVAYAARFPGLRTFNTFGGFAAKLSIPQEYRASCAPNVFQSNQASMNHVAVSSVPSLRHVFSYR